MIKRPEPAAFAKSLGWNLALIFISIIILMVSFAWKDFFLLSFRNYMNKKEEHIIMLYYSSVLTFLLVVIVIMALIKWNNVPKW